MARVCDICGKGPMTGNKIVRSGLPKKTGGIGLNTTGVSRRRFLPNLQRIRIIENGGVKRKTVCTVCIKSDRVVKA